MSCAALLLALALGAQGPFEASLEATGRGEYRAALRLADAATVPDVERARARLWAFYRAGLLDRALSAAEAGLAEAPGDPWLLARAVELAVGLHHPGSAARHLEAWEAAQPAPRDAGEEALRAEARALVASEVRRAAALDRARGVAAAVLVGGAAAVVLLGRGRP